MKDINLVEILKNAPVGTILYSPLCGKCTIERIEVNKNDIYPIHLKTKRGSLQLTKYGKFNTDYDGECLLFPRAWNRNWGVWQHSLINIGDYVTNINGATYQIIESKDSIGQVLAKNTRGIIVTLRYCNLRYASVEEIEKYNRMLLGYIENSETEEEIKTEEEIEKVWSIDDFKPFDKVLVKDEDSIGWKCDIFSSYYKNDKFPYHCIGNIWANMIPYNEETKHLLGTKDDTPKKYKIWEN